MTTTEGDRLRTIDSLSEEFCVSVGFIQKALTTIEHLEITSLQIIRRRFCGDNHNAADRA
ncbi:helix-turn-helix domain-containing protein [Vibrio anguillarum]|uniref:helix-turn-helix domain-containing protein n=1 Tax=Vibrio anguillarum TaxID=55601 RepID=UPI001F293CEE|nr:helix-turn-helix domain-containing protein [Vibrio anguillarum]